METLRRRKARLFGTSVSSECQFKAWDRYPDKQARIAPMLAAHPENTGASLKAWRENATPEQLAERSRRLSISLKLAYSELPAEVKSAKAAAISERAKRWQQGLTDTQRKLWRAHLVRGRSLAKAIIESQWQELDTIALQAMETYSPKYREPQLGIWLRLRAIQRGELNVLEVYGSEVESPEYIKTRDRVLQQHKRLRERMLPFLQRHPEREVLTTLLFVEGRYIPKP